MVKFLFCFPFCKFLTGNEATLRSCSFLLRKGGGGLFRSGFECFDEILCFSRIFSLTSVRRWPVFIRPFSLSYRMKQLSAYEEGEQPTPNADLESGQEKTSGSCVSVLPDLSQDGDLAPPSSVPAGPVTCRQDLQLPCPSWEGARTLLGFSLYPRLSRNLTMPSYSALDAPSRSLPCRSRSLPLRCLLRTSWRCLRPFLDRSRPSRDRS